MCIYYIYILYIHALLKTPFHCELHGTVHKINIQLNELSHTHTHAHTHTERKKKTHYPGKEREGSLYSIVYEIHLFFYTWL